MSHAVEKPIPDVLFKYCDAGAIAALDGEQTQMMFSKPADLNDPFEFLPDLEWLFNLQARKLLELGFESVGLPQDTWAPSFLISELAKDWKREISLHWFVTSFTSADHNVRMWAQYGGNHTGIKLTLNLARDPLLSEKSKMGWVDYKQPKRADISRMTNRDLTAEDKADLLKQVATQKGKDWDHEEEIRWFLRDEGSPNHISKRLLNGKMKAFFSLPHSCIQRVTVGYQSDESLLNSILEIKKKYQATWQVAKAKLSLNSFQFEDELVRV